jgi:hypothetical protein
MIGIMLDDLREEKTFFKKASIRIRYVFKPFRNLIANSSSLDKINSFAWILLFFSFLLPFIAVETHRISVFNTLIFSSGFIFVIIFVYEGAVFWKKQGLIFKQILAILTALTSFLSIFIARCILVYCTGVEPESISNAAVVFSLIAEIFLLIIVFTFTLFIIYCLVLLLTIVFPSLLPLAVLLLQVINDSPVCRFLFRKSIQKNVVIVNFQHLLFKNASRFMGLAFLLVFGFYISVFLLDIYSAHQPYLLQTAEEMIVYANYRPNSYFTECNDLNEGEWGLLLKNKKLVLQSQSI